MGTVGPDPGPVGGHVVSFAVRRSRRDGREVTVQVPPRPGTETQAQPGPTVADESEYDRIDLQDAPWPYFADDEVEAARRVLTSGRVNYWTGTEGTAFESEYAGHLGRRFGIAVANGTVALELALVALGIGPGDEVITSPRTFIASASAAVMRGATPVLADVDRDSGNITAASVERVMTSRTRAIVAVHLAGWPCDMDALMDLARSRDVHVIEDCAQAHGATYHGAAVGSIGDMASFSFCQDKIISTAGEGGMLVLDDDAWRKHAWAYKDHGKDYDTVFADEQGVGYRWVHHSFGTNWRMPEVQAAVGRIQLRKLDRWLELRRRNANILRSYLEPNEVFRVPVPSDNVRHAYYKFYAFVRNEALKTGWSRDRLLAAFQEIGVPCKIGSASEIYRERAFERAGFGLSEPLPIARELTHTSMMFEVHPTLTEDVMHAIGSRLARIAKQARR